MNRENITFPARHTPLREDIHALGDLMGEVLREQGGDELLALVDQDRLTAIRWRSGTTGAGEALAVRVRGRPSRLAREVLRGFSSYFQLVNVAEKYIASGAGASTFNRMGIVRSPAAWRMRSPS